MKTDINKEKKLLKEPENEPENPDFIWNKIKKSDGSDMHLLVSELRYVLSKNMHLSKMSIIIEYINKISNGNKNVRILDYGSGGGQLVAFLHLIGYTNISAVDIYSEERVNGLNRLFSKAKMRGIIFYSYDKITLPFENDQFDLIVSQQVIEHVSNIEQYISECHRVLSRNGRALLDFPHKMVPFDTHTRMWFVHYFPIFIRKYFYDKYRDNERKQYFNFLYLRTPFFYNSLFKRVFDKVEDFTVDRISEFRYKDHYEGNRKLRGAIDKIFHLPIVGYFSLKIATFFVNKTVVLYK
ncbi:class I SAM-dependent methyltransferase [bacterium]|jgi:SAM-dependent methyltransferase|nr:class I SAM-dependent methyltransferase [bacterium]